MSNETAIDVDANAVMADLERAADNFSAALYERLAALSQISSEISALRSSLAAASTSLGLLCLQVACIGGLVLGVFFLEARLRKRKTTESSAWRTFFFKALAVVLALGLGFVAARFLAPPGVGLRTLRLWTVAIVALYVVLSLTKFILLASRPPELRHRSFRMLSFVHDLSFSMAWAMLGVALVTTSQILGSGPGIKDFIRTILVAIPAYLLFAAAVWRHRRTLAAVVAGPQPRGRLRGQIARRWPAIVVVFLCITFISTQAALTFGAPLPGTAVLSTILMLLLTPHLDAMIWNWARRKLEAPHISIAAAAARQTARFALFIIAISMLGALWATPLALGLGFDLRSVAREAFGLALIALAAAYLWNAVGSMTDRALRVRRQTTTDEDGLPEAPRSRLGTIVPLLGAVGKSSIVALALLSILVSMGVNVWPLITGLSVFGLAIGFGSQTLVKDVVSGLFFLIDDAFRFGEYIETSGAKGTVEKISIRSVSLRNSRGSIATVPYGQIGKIQNFSRDWAIEKFAFRVAFDTDVELVRKLFKKIGQDIAADPELSADLLEPFKSQGIGDVEDGTLIIKAKFTAKPGKQSMIRRAILTAVQSAFREHGIQAVPKPMTANAEPSA